MPRSVRGRMSGAMLSAESVLRQDDGQAPSGYHAPNTSPISGADPVAIHIAALLALAAPLVTVAEKTDYKASSRHADVVAFCEQLAKDSAVVRLAELGTSHEGRKLPLLVLADPP